MSQRFDFAEVYIYCKFKGQHIAAPIFFLFVSVDTANSSLHLEAVDVIKEPLLCGRSSRSHSVSVTQLDTCYSDYVVTFFYTFLLQRKIENAFGLIYLEIFI